MSASARHAFLVTVTPGNELSRAFGHVAIAFEEGGPVAYSYGGYALPDVPARVACTQVDRAEYLGVFVSESLMPVLTGTVMGRKMREPLSEFELKMALSQRLVMDPLDLTPRQIRCLHRAFQSDFARRESGAIGAECYAYDHFASNCATRIRDGITSCLTDDPKSFSSRLGEENKSFEQVIEETLALAQASHQEGVELVPPGIRDALEALLPAHLLQPRDAQGFLRLIRIALAYVSGSSRARTADVQVALARARRLLDVEIPKRPRERYELSFTPKSLREALQTWPNPETKRPVLRATQGE